MKIMIITVISFLAAFYVYNYIKHKKRKSQNMNTVADFKQKYLKELNKYKKKDGQIDYVDRLDLIKETEKMKEINTKSITIQKQNDWLT